MDRAVSIQCKTTQYKVPFGDTACTAVALIFARLALEGIPAVEDLDTIIRAGGMLWKKWSDGTPDMHAMSFWSELSKCFPTVMKGMNVSFEVNGFMDGEPNEDFMVEPIESALGRIKEPASAVITINGGSYGAYFDDGKAYLFDSHGGRKPSDNATLWGWDTTKDLKSFFDDKALCTSEYSMVVFQSAIR